MSKVDELLALPSAGAKPAPVDELLALPTRTQQQSASRSDYLINSAKKGVENLLSLGPALADTAQRSQGVAASYLSWLANAPDAVTSYFYRRAAPEETMSGDLRRGYRGLTGTSDMDAPDALTRYGGKAIEFGVSALPFSANTILSAAHRVPAFMAEVGSSMLGGVGHEAGGDIGYAVAGDGGRAAGQLVGSLGGSVAGMATPTAFSKVWAMVSPNLSEAGRRASVDAIAGSKLRGAMDANPSTASNMTEAERVAARLQEKGAGEFRPTIGQVTGAEGVQSIEGQIARKTPEDLGRYAQRATDNRQVVDRAKDIDFPAGGDFQRGAARVERTTVKALDARLDALTDAQQRLAARMSGTGQQAAGERLQELRAAAQTAARASRDAKIQDIYATADRMGVRENMDDAVALVRRIAGNDANTFQSMPPVFRQVIENYAPKQPTGRYIPPDLMAESGMTPKAATFQEVHSLWRETNSQLATAQRVGDMNAAHYLGQLKDVLKAKLSKYEAEGHGELATKFREFNQWFSTKYAPAFYEGVGGRMSATSRYGEVVKPEQVVGKFFTPSGIDDFQLIYQGNRDAQNALRDGVLGMFAEKAVRDGRIDPKAAQAFLRSNAETLNKVPDIKATLSDGSALNEALVQRAYRLKTAQSDLANSAVAQIVKTENPAGLVQAALTDRAKLLSLISAAKDPASKQAVLRSIADNIPAAASKAGMDPLAFVVKNEDSLRSVMNRLGPQHYENLKLLASAETILGRTQTPASAVTPKMAGAVEELTGSSPRTIWAQTANAAAGRQSHVSAALHLLTRFGIRTAENRADEVLREVIYNPALAKDLVIASNRPYSVGMSNRLSEHLRNAGIRIVAENKGEE